MLTIRSTSIFSSFLLALVLAPEARAGGPETTQGIAEDAVRPERTRAPARGRFLAVAASALGVAPEQVTLARIEGPLVFRDAGIEAFLCCAHDADGTKTTVALDGAGNVLQLGHLRRAQAVVTQKLRGKRSRGLAAKLAALEPGERVPVAVWVAVRDTSELREACAEILGDWERAGLLTQAMAEHHQYELARDVKERLAPDLARAEQRLRQLGYEVDGSAGHAPIVFLRANAAEIHALGSSAFVRQIDHGGAENAERLAVARVEVRADLANTMTGGSTGTGARVAVLEGGRPCTTNPDMTITATRDTSVAVSSHTTGVASCIASRHGTTRGIAPDATVYAASGVAAGLQGTVDAVDWSIAQGAMILNLSYGAADYDGNAMSARDAYLDYVARTNARTICVAAGNSGTYAGDPGAGYNQISVGNFNDRGSGAWTGTETMNATSSWENPDFGLETPQVAAPGTNIDMLDCSGPDWTGYSASGTSFSSPIVAGECALIHSKTSSLRVWPEAVRAIVMATAWHNIEGDADLSDRDGAGGIDARAAVRVAGRARGTGYQYGSLTTSSFDANGWYTAQSYSVTAGQRVRACLSWDSGTSAVSGTYGSRLIADLDLFVTRPDGVIVASSGSELQPFEVVEFVAPSTGTYTVKLRHYGLGPTGSEYFGTALSVQGDI